MGGGGGIKRESKKRVFSMWFLTQFLIVSIFKLLNEEMKTLSTERRDEEIESLPLSLPLPLDYRLF